MTNLKTVEGMNKFCGPAVLSILTGKTTDECAAAITYFNGQYNVTGVMLGDLLKAADKLGFDQIPITASGSLYGVLTHLVRQDGMYIVTLPRHFVCIEVSDKKIYFCDNHTKEPIPAASSARLMQTVMNVHLVKERPKPVLLSSELNVRKVTSYGDGIRVEITRVSIYDQDRYNLNERLVHVYLKDEKEFITLVAKLSSL